MRGRIIPPYIPAIKLREKIFLDVGTYIFLAAIIDVFAHRKLYYFNLKLHIVEKLDDMSLSIIGATQ